MISTGCTLGARFQRLIPVARCSAAPSVVIAVIGNGDVARFRRNHSVVVSFLVVVLAPGDPSLRVLESRFQRHLLPVAYSDSWYSGSGLVRSKIAMASSKA